MIPPPAPRPTDGGLDRSTPPLGAGAALGLAFGSFLTSQAILFAVTALTDRIVLALALGAAVGVLLPVSLILWNSGRDPIRSLGLDRFRPRDAGLAMLLVAFAFAPTYALGVLGQRIFPPGPDAYALYEGLIPTGPAAVFFGGLVVVLVAPLAEEVLYRGLMLGALARWLPLGAALPLQAVAFAISHGMLWMLWPITILGLLLGLLRTGTASLVPAWIAHGVFNLVAYVDLCLTGDVRGARLEAWAQEPWVLIPSTVGAVVLAVHLARRSPGAAIPDELHGGDDPLVAGRDG